MIRFRGVALVLCMAAALMLVAGCAIVPITGRRQLSLVSQPELIGMAAQNYQEFIGASTISSDTGARDMVSEVGGRVATATSEFMLEHGMEYELSQYDWEFTLIEDEAVNAFCMPGGKIVVYTGLLPVARTKTGLSVVVAHEVAHAIANHGGERMSQLLLAELGGLALSKAVEQKPDQTRDLAMLAYGIGSQVAVLLPYSRQHESEADRIGLTLMARAGYDPRQALDFWQRMSEQSEGQPPEILSTHPSHSTRIGDIRQHLPEAVAIFENR